MEPKTNIICDICLTNKPKYILSCSKNHTCCKLCIESDFTKCSICNTKLYIKIIDYETKQIIDIPFKYLNQIVIQNKQLHTTPILTHETEYIKDYVFMEVRTLCENGEFIEYPNIKLNTPVYNFINPYTIDMYNELISLLPYGCMENKTFILNALKININIFKWISDELKIDNDILMCAIKIDGYSIMFLNSNQLTVGICGNAIFESYNNANGFIKKFNDSDVYVQNMVNDYGMNLEYASDRLKSDKSTIMVAVSKNGMSIIFAPKDLCSSDEEILYTAVKNNGNVILFLNAVYRDKKKFCIAAVTNKGCIYKKISPNMKKDEDIAFSAVCEDIVIFNDIVPELKESISFQKRILDFYRELSNSNSDVSMIPYLNEMFMHIMNKDLNTKF